MLFQRASELAVRAMVFLARQDPGKLSPVREIAADSSASEAYLSKILQRLTGAGLVRSFRGPGKGMELGRAPSAITLVEIIHAVEGVQAEQACIFGLGHCDQETPCALHRQWLPIRSALCDLLENTTLADLAEAARQDASQEVGAPVGDQDSAAAALLPERRQS